MIGWQHAFNGGAPTQQMQFASTGTGFTVAGVPLAQDALVLEAGTRLAISDTVGVDLDYQGLFANGTSSNTFKATGTIKF